MRKPAWYVIQVQTGKERAVCAALERACASADQLRSRAWSEAVAAAEQAALEVEEDAVARTGASARSSHPDRPGCPVPILEECFCPSFTHRLKFHGEWRDVQRPLLPGYVVAVTADPARLTRVLRHLSDFARMLVMGETFVPLRDDERAWIENNTRAGNRVVPISIAHREGDKLVVTEGPLKGREGTITRVDRRKCLAHVEIHAGAMTIRTTVGLAIMPAGDSTTGVGAGNDVR